MSGECDKCGEHALECECSKTIIVNGETAFRHAMMPYKNALAGPIPHYVNQLFGKQCYLSGPIVCKKCEKQPIDCECL